MEQETLALFPRSAPLLHGPTPERSSSDLLQKKDCILYTGTRFVGMVAL